MKLSYQFKRILKDHLLGISRKHHYNGAANIMMSRDKATHIASMRSLCSFVVLFTGSTEILGNREEEEEETGSGLVLSSGIATGEE